MVDVAREKEAPASVAPSREPLNRERVLRAAVALADDAGLEALSMRRLGQRLGVEAMSLYNHVSSKDDLLDGMTELVLREVNDEVATIAGPESAADWQPVLRTRVLTARRVMLRHRWLPSALESRTTMGPAVVLYYDGVLGILRAGGFSYGLAHHALHALGSRALGFTQELFDPGADGDDGASEDMLAAMAERVPHLVGMMTEIAHEEGPDSTLGWCDDQTEFEFGLDIVLEGLDRRRERASS